MSDEVVWEKSGDGIIVWTATQSAGRGMLVNDDILEAEREAIAEEMEAEIRDKRCEEWQP